MSDVWVNGVPQELIPASDRGLAYGDGLFETIRVARGKTTLDEYHWQRLQVSCQRLGITLSLPQLLDEVAAFLPACGADCGVMKVIVTRGSGGRGYNPQGCDAPRRILSLHPLAERDTDPAVVGARVRMCQLRLARSALPGVKHLNRLEQVLARAEWQGDHYHEGLLCDDRGHLIEGTMSNLFVVTHSGELITPDLSFCGVRGVCRDFIIDLARRRGLTVREELVSPRLDVAEVFLCNSVNGVWPVVECADRVWPIGPVTALMRDCVLEKLHG